MPDFIGVLAARGFDFRRRGGENYEGACPRCGGDDRIQIMLEGDRYNAEPHWFCRQAGGCGQCERGSGDLPYFLMTFGEELYGHQVRYPEACEKLGVAAKGQKYSGTSSGTSFRHFSPNGRDSSKSSRHFSSKTAPEPEKYPSDEWMAEAEKLTAWAEGQLWQSAEGQAYLAERFIEPETARAFRLGWVPQKFFPEREAWGLPPVMKKDGRPKKVWISNGLLIPTLRKRGVVAVTIRRNDFKQGDELPKICQVASGVPALYIMAGSIGQPVVIVEGPLDALLVWQESKGTVAALSPIGTTKTLSALPSQVVQMIEAAPLALLTLDNDGIRGDAKQDTGLLSSKAWLERFPRLIMHRTPTAKDPGDYIKAGGDFKGFLAYGIRKNIHRVYEINGRTTCSAALAALTGEVVDPAAFQVPTSTASTPSAGGARADHAADFAPMAMERPPVPSLSMPDMLGGRPVCYLPQEPPERLRDILPPDLRGMGIPKEGLPLVMRGISSCGWTLRDAGGELELMAGHGSPRNEDGVRGYLRVHREQIKATWARMLQERKAEGVAS